MRGMYDIQQQWLRKIFRSHWQRNLSYFSRKLQFLSYLPSRRLKSSIISSMSSSASVSSGTGAGVFPS